PHHSHPSPPPTRPPPPHTLHSFPTRRSSDLLTLEKGSEAGGILSKGGVTPQNLNSAIEALRKGRTADSATAENAYEALKKYSREDRKSTRLNSSHVAISYAVFCLKKKKK